MLSSSFRCMQMRSHVPSSSRAALLWWLLACSAASSLCDDSRNGLRLSSSKQNEEVRLIEENTDGRRLQVCRKKCRKKKSRPNKWQRCLDQCRRLQNNNGPWTKQGNWELIETVPHDRDAFTQGLVYVKEDGGRERMFEGTGLYRKSDIREINIRNGNTLQITDLADRYFGEGICYYTDGNGNPRLIQITWREQTGFIYNADNLSQRLETFAYTTETNEGWGITHRPNTNQFLVSDGSHYIHFWNDETRQVVRNRLAVRIYSQGMASAVNQRRLNELEWDSFTNTLLANIWTSNSIVRINVSNGRILTEYDLSDLDRPLGADVLNGIALTDEPNVIWVTGKLWSNRYKIRLLD